QPIAQAIESVGRCGRRDAAQAEAEGDGLLFQTMFHRLHGFILSCAGRMLTGPCSASNTYLVLMDDGGGRSPPVAAGGAVEDRGGCSAPDGIDDRSSGLTRGKRMKSYKFVAAAVLSLGLLGLTMGADEKPKFTIKEVMKEAHKNKLRDKVIKGD